LNYTIKCVLLMIDLLNSTVDTPTESNCLSCWNMPFLKKFLGYLGCLVKEGLFC
jgi:hypothetical protein